MKAYAIACEDVTLEAMAIAAKLYIQGKVKRDNQTFAPSAAEFAEQVRYQQLVIDAANRPREQKQIAPEPEQTPEQRARLAYKINLLSKFQAGDQSVKDELQGLVSFSLDDMNEMKGFLAR